MISQVTPLVEQWPLDDFVLQKGHEVSDAKTASPRHFVLHLALKIAVECEVVEGPWKNHLELCDSSIMLTG